VLKFATIPCKFETNADIAGFYVFHAFWREGIDMLRVLFQFSIVVTLAAFAMPSISSDAEAGKRYGRSHGKSWSHSGRASHRSYRGSRRVRGGFILHIPQAYLNGNGVVEAPVRRYYRRSGPKIINVPEALRRQGWSKYSD
jgi:hypothetical protein